MWAFRGGNEMKTGHTPIPRYRPTTWPRLFTQGFRPFFLLAGLWAPAGLLLTLGVMFDVVALPIDGAATIWHGHEMLFGFVAAAIAGFVLTAVPNWTGRLPLQGAPLALLVAFWLAGRIAMALGGQLGAPAAGAIDMLFLLGLAAAVGREVVAGRNWRNLPVVGVLLVLVTTNALYHVQAAGWVELDDAPLRLGVATVAFLVSLIGGRVVPSFTRNALAKRGETKLPATTGPLDGAHLVATASAGLLWTVWPESMVTGTLLAVAAILGIIRLARWQGMRTLHEPLLWSLHLGYVWLPIAFALLAASALGDAVPRSAGLHALTAGAFGAMILAVTSRATLGHTGRPLTAGPGLAACYILVAVAAALRVAAAVIGSTNELLLAGSAASWCAGFIAFLWVCGPMLIGQRPVKG